MKERKNKIQKEREIMKMEVNNSVKTSSVCIFIIFLYLTLIDSFTL